MQLNNIDSTKKWADFSKIICKWAYFYSTIFICAIEEELKPFPQNEIRQMKIITNYDTNTLYKFLIYGTLFFFRQKITPLEQVYFFGVFVCDKNDRSIVRWNSDLVILLSQLMVNESSYGIKANG